MKESSTKFPHELLIDEFQQRIYERSSCSYSVLYIYTQHCGLEDMKAVNEINSFKAKFSICLFEEELIIRSSAFACLIGSKSIIKEKNEPTSKSFSRNTH